MMRKKLTPSATNTEPKITKITNIFSIIKLEKDIGDDVNVLLNNEKLDNNQVIEVKWKNKTVSKHSIKLEYVVEDHSCHNDKWTACHYKPFIEIIHNDTPILVSALGLKARKI